MLDSRPLVTGARATVKHAYRTAATLTGWTLTIDPATRVMTFAAIVDSADAYLLTQTPLELVLHTARGTSRWPMTTCRVSDRHLYADLGILDKKGPRAS